MCEQTNSLKMTINKMGITPADIKMVINYFNN